MTNITKKQKTMLENSIDQILSKTRKWRHYFPARDYQLLHWTEEELDTVTKAVSLVSNAQLDSKIGWQLVNVDIEGCGRRALSFRLDAPPTTPCMMWPCHLGQFRDGVDPKPFFDVVDGVVQAAYERGRFKTVFTFLLENCITHEAIAYLFPAYTQIMRNVNMTSLAVEIEDKQSRPSLPVRTPRMNKMIREVNQWWATHALLGTWNEMRSMSQDDLHIEVTLGGNHSFEDTDEDGRAVFTSLLV